MNPHQVTKDFEAALCEYTGAKYAVAVNSCTMALLLAVGWHRQHRYGAWKSLEVDIPKRTYVSVPQSIIHAGGRPTFRDEEWKGLYQLKPLPVWDSARWFTSGMYASNRPEHTPSKWRCIDSMICVSFHASKTLGLEQGGAILHDNPEADAWFRRARFDGRTEGVTPKNDVFTQVGWHCYPNPSMSAQGILRLHSLPSYNEELPNDEYPDLSEMQIFN